MGSIFGIPLEIIPSKARKRSIGFRVSSDGVIVRTPLRYSESSVISLLEKRKNWILKSWEKVQKKTLRQERSFTEASLFPHLGESLSLHIIYHSSKNLCISDGVFLNVFIKDGDESKIENLIKNWYKKQALLLLPERVSELAKKHNFPQLKSTFIKSYKAKYGMCKGSDIYLDYKIIELKSEIIDHIILHELTHLTHKHHQISFRNKLASLDPNWREHRDVLRGKVD